MKRARLLIRERFTLYLIRESIRRSLRADEFGPACRCAYCDRRIAPLSRVALAYDGDSPAHLRCTSSGRMPLNVNRRGRS